MISKDTYDKMKKNYGKVGSWAVWRMPEEGERPRARTGCLSIFDSPNIAAKLNNRYVFIGLNLSEQDSPVEQEVWRNFHSTDNRRQQDYKLRYALYGTKYWGAYITDALKGIRKTNSAEVMQWVRNSPDGVEKQMASLRDEISALGGNPTLVPIGGDSFELIHQYFQDFVVIGIMHYANYIGKERYRDAVLEALKGH